MELRGKCLQGLSVWIEIPKTVSMRPEELKPRQPSGILIDKAGKRKLSQALYATAGFGPLSLHCRKLLKAKYEPTVHT